MATGDGKSQQIRQIYPPKLDGVYLHRQVYQTSRFSPLDNDDLLINRKIKSAFRMLNDTFPLKGLILQFWAPIRTTNSGKLLLSTSVQPFAFASLNRRLRKYRNCSVKCRYSIYHNDNIKVEEGERVMIINNGLPAAAFLKRLPELVFDLKTIYQRNPLVSFAAFNCDLTCSIMLPVFNQTSSSCLGVVECSMNPSGLPLVFNHLKHALKSVGLSIYHVQPSLQYNRIHHTAIEIEKAIDRLLCQFRHFALLGDDDDGDDLVIVTLYKDDATLFLLPPNSSSLALAKEKINQDFRFDPASNYKLQYEANEGQWFSLHDDASFNSCILFRRGANKNHVKLRVHMLDN